MGRERRQHKRAAVKLNVRLYVSGKKEPVIGHVENISVGGAFIVCHTEMTLGKRVLLELELTGSQLIHARVTKLDPKDEDGKSEVVQGSMQVRWAANDGFGVEFLDLSEEARETIARIVESAAEAA